MNPKQFLLIGGIVLVVVGILGFVGVTGPTSEQSIFGEAWWFDNIENWAHLVLGIVAVIAAYVLPMNLQKPLVIVVGVLALFVAAWNIMSTDFLGAMLQRPFDLVLHLVVGIWALWSVWGGKMMKGSSTPPMNTGAPMA